MPKKLQNPATSSEDYFFHGVLEKQKKTPTLKDRLDSKAKIIENHNFEMGIVNTKNSDEGTLSRGKECSKYV